MTVESNRLNRQTRLDDAMDYADAIIGSGPVTMIPGEIEHNARVLTRFIAAANVLSHAGFAFANCNGDLSSPSYKRFDAKRAVIRKSLKVLKDRAVSYRSVA